MYGGALARCAPSMAYGGKRAMHRRQTTTTTTTPTTTTAAALSKSQNQSQMHNEDAGWRTQSSIFHFHILSKVTLTHPRYITKYINKSKIKERIAVTEPQ
jgi:hypothetical protein